MQSWGFDSYGRDLAKSGAIASWNTGNSYWNKFINGPGDEFKSKDEAATDFGMEYNAISIYLGTAGNLLGDAALIEGGVRFFKYLSKIFSNLPNETQLLKAANTVDKSGYTAVGRALTKHGNREGTAFPKAVGSRGNVNSKAENVLINIINSSGVKINTTNHFKHGKVIEYMTPNGQRARFSADGKKFIGLLEK